MRKHLANPDSGRLNALTLLDARKFTPVETAQRLGVTEATLANCGFRRRRALIPKGTRTAFRAEGEQFSERSDAGFSILQ